MTGSNRAQLLTRCLIVLGLFLLLGSLALAAHSLLLATAIKWWAMWLVGLLYLAYELALMLFVFWQLRQLKQHSPQQAALNYPTASPTASPSLTVLIPARNEQLLLAKCLDAVFMQSLRPQQIIVVDDGSTDCSAALLQQHYAIATTVGRQHSTLYANLSVLRLPHQGKAQALNQALACVETDLVMTLDADTQLHPHALAAFVAAFQHDPSLVAAGGVLNPVLMRGEQHNLVAKSLLFFQKFEYQFGYLSRAAWDSIQALLLVSGACATYRSAVLRQIGGFDPNSMVEDYEINHRIYRYAAQHQYNWRVGIVGHAKANTDAAQSLQAFLQQRRRWFGGFLQTQWQHRAMIANAKYGQVGLKMLPIKLLDAVQPLLGLFSLLLIIYLIVQSLLHWWMVLGLLFLKFTCDLLFYYWGAAKYQTWTQSVHELDCPKTMSSEHSAYTEPSQLSFMTLILATLLWPFSFMWLRLLAALLGWWTFLTRAKIWMAQR